MKIQFNKKLGSKITLYMLAMLLMVSVISTLVVSVIIQRQNHALIQEAMANSADTLRHTLIEKQNALSQTTQQMISTSRVGENLVFLESVADFQSAGIKQDAYNELIESVLRNAASGSAWQTAIYDGQKNLVVFAVQENSGGYRIGYQEAGKVHHTLIRSGGKIAEIVLKEDADSINTWLAGSYAGAIPTHERVGFEIIAERLCLKVEIPVVAETFNVTAGKMEPKLVGIAVTVMHLGPDFATWINKLTGIRVAIFSRGTFSAGDMTAYTSIETAGLRQSTGNNWQLESARALFSSITIEKQGYFQNVLPIYAGADYIGAVALLQSDAAAKANNRQMIFILCGVGAA